MKYIEFDESRPMDLVLLGRVAIDFNPAYNDQVKEEFKPLKKVHMFEKFVGGCWHLAWNGRCNESDREGGSICGSGTGSGDAKEAEENGLRLQ